MDIAVDPLPQPLQVVLLDDAAFGSDASQGARASRIATTTTSCSGPGAGDGSHSIDGERFAVAPGHRDPDRARAGPRVRARAAALRRGRALRAARCNSKDRGWLVGGRGVATVAVPPSEVPTLESHDRDAGRRDRAAARRAAASISSATCSRSLLLWVERWYDATRTDAATPTRPTSSSIAASTQVLERDFARHHDAAHYADALAVPAAQLSRALAHVTGRTTKQLVTDRVMLEAARLLRFTDLTVGEIAFRAGFEDQLYFSRAFKRHYGASPDRRTVNNASARVGASSSSPSSIRRSSRRRPSRANGSSSACATARAAGSRWSPARPASASRRCSPPGARPS